MSNVMTNHGYARLRLDNPVVDYSKIESFQKTMYLVMLKANEEVKKKLEGSSRLNAYFNDMATFYILDTICSTIREDKKLAILMMKKESKRLQDVINSYRQGEVEKYSIWEMKSILSDYMDEEKIKEALIALYKDQAIIKSDDTSQIKGVK